MSECLRNLVLTTSAEGAEIYTAYVGLEQQKGDPTIVPQVKGAIR
jgi:hypothetical protein